MVPRSRWRSPHVLEQVMGSKKGKESSKGKKVPRIRAGRAIRCIIRVEVFKVMTGYLPVIIHLNSMKPRSIAIIMIHTCCPRCRNRAKSPPRGAPWIFLAPENMGISPGYNQQNSGSRIKSLPIWGFFSCFGRNWMPEDPFALTLIWKVQSFRSGFQWNYNLVL